jgi:serine/threonine-protein kinase
MATAVAIAVFGSHHLRKLYQRAHEAQRIGQYQLKQILGFGGMGTVYLAEHVLLRRPCAIKLIRPDQAGDPRTLMRFECEVQAAATLTHWNTIEIFDYGHAEDGTFYYYPEQLIMDRLNSGRTWQTDGRSNFSRPLDAVGYFASTSEG